MGLSCGINALVFKFITISSSTPLSLLLGETSSKLSLSVNISDAATSLSTFTYFSKETAFPEI